MVDKLMNPKQKQSLVLNQSFFRTSAAQYFRVSIFLTSLSSGPAEVRYVDSNSTNATPPYTDWATAATNIQDAVDAALTGDGIVVANGIYATGGRPLTGDTTSNRVAVDKPLNLTSVNGPQSTTIDGGLSNRCLYLANGASLSGFTLANGRAHSGGGLRCESTNALVYNCVVSGNSAFMEPIFSPIGAPCCGLNRQPAFAGGVYGGTLNNCILLDNRAENSGSSFTCDYSTCTIMSALGQVSHYPGLGGGAGNAVLNNCTLTGNWAGYGGGAYGCTLNNCTLIGNTAYAYSADYGDGTVVVGSGGGADNSILNNCIAYFNTAPEAPNYYSCTVNYSCATPLPTSGLGNISSDPLFVNRNGWANLRLQSNSPCVNAGANSLAPAGPDWDGNPRIVGGTVDIGAFEYQSPTSIISYAWLQQYGLPTDGSADFTDPDGDGLNNWQEWRCGTDPTNALSALRLLAPLPVGTNVTVTWQSVAGGSYFVERATTLSVPLAFTSLATNIPGQPGTTTYIDTDAAPPGQFFYRVGVPVP
jgi:hypothetical protein